MFGESLKMNTFQICNRYKLYNKKYLYIKSVFYFFCG